MILTCPACRTSYSVKDGAIPPQGRTVRCAACKHSWHQADEGEEAQTPAPVEAEEMAPNDDPEPEAELVEDAPHRATPDAIAPVAALDALPAGEPDSAVADVEPVAQVMPEPALVADDNDWNDAPYGEEEAPPRRKGMMIMLALVLLVAALAAAAYFLAPSEWMARAGLAAASGDSPLKLMVTSQNRQKLASGNDLVSLSGRVINPTDQTEPVPALQAELRDGAGKLVYSWMIPPPAPRLAPRASASFNAAELGVPANATSLTLRWAS